MEGDGLYLLGGLCLLLAVVLPLATRGRAVSSPMVLVAMGLLLGWSPLADGWPDRPSEHPVVVERVAELAVIVALMGVGLALDRPLDLRRLAHWRRWSSTWRLLAVAMPLTIAAVAFLGWWAAGLPVATAILLGAVLAPTDPVLASDVQVGGPGVSAPSVEEDVEEHAEEPDEVRFALTAEAGLNDGLAFPFVYLAILVAAGFSVADAGVWVGWYVVGKVVLGVAVGIAVGKLMGLVVFRTSRRLVRLAAQSDPVVAVAALFTAYGLAEVLHGYGFLAAFACGMSLRAAERHHDYHREMHDVIERLERLLTLIVLLLLGIAMSRGLLERLDLAGVLVGTALVLLVRPLSGLFSLAAAGRTEGRGGLCREEQLAVAFFGVRGVGSIYYLAWATNHGDFAHVPWLWSTVAFTITLSVLLHGVTAAPVMHWLDRRRGEVTPAGR
jgi:NhaP-type Na+/H+ or K+/H+ antiporter